MIITCMGELTPLEGYNNIIYKRDDLYMPYDDMPLSGGKVRQAQALIKENLTYIQDKCNNTVATASSLFSPQSVIMARVAKEFGVKCIIGVGGGKSVEHTVENHGMIKASQECGAEIRVLSKLGYNSALYSKLNEMQKQEHFYNVGFGLASEDPDSPVLQSIIHQVQNLPKEIENLIIPVGSGIQMGAICIGVLKYKIKVKNLIGIQIADKSRLSTINELIHNSGQLGFFDKPKYQFYQDASYAYHDMVEAIPFEGFQLSAVYEAKAWHAMKQLDLNWGVGKTVFWVVGNENMTRELYQGKLKYSKLKSVPLKKVK